MSDIEREPRREGRLSIVATPIGNLEDITLRAIRTLREADAILAEDTRRTRHLCTHHAIGTRLRSFHAHTPPARIAPLVEELKGGAHLALVTDAGTPLVSDPGAQLVRAAAEAGVRVESIPGPSAALAALSSAGFAVPRFEFVGFLPRGGGRRTALLAELAKQRGAVVLFEAPSRLAATLRDLAGAIGERPIAVCRELTKLHEEIARGTAASLAEHFAGEVRGELTLVLAPREEGDEDAPEWDEDALRKRARALLDEGSSARDVASALSELAGIARRDAYRIANEEAARGEE